MVKSAREVLSGVVQKPVEDLALLEAPLHRGVAHELQFTRLGYRDAAHRFLVATAKRSRILLLLQRTNGF
jgi:hypothetical protein